MTDGLWLPATPVFLATLVLIGAQAALSARTLRLPAQAPDRLVAELRLAQFSALVLGVTCGTYLGLASVHPQSAVDVLLALTFFAVAAVAPLRDPREGLTALALAFAAYAVIDVLHRPGFLAEDVAPRELLFMTAVHHALAGALCYLPVLRR
ncbi:MAG: hypothetical protein U0Q12_15540 [Vicinamibacterales bacterium]